MGLTKQNDYAAVEHEVARYARALAHPARVAILRIILEKEACICGDIVEEIGLSQSTVSQHLKELKKIGLLKGSIDGPRVCYCIDPDAWKAASEAFGLFFSQEITAQSCEIPSAEDGCSPGTCC